MSLRRWFFTGLGLLAAVMISMAPASALDREPGLYDVMFVERILVVPDAFIAEDVAAVVPLTLEPTPERQMSAFEALGPIYALSLETHGQSLPTRFHMRC